MSEALVAALDGDRLLDDLEQLARFGAGRGAGINRIAYDDADRAGRAWVESQLRDLGLSVRTDAAGNSSGVYAGSDAGLPALALGSHTDTVPDGGMYDGALGVLAALACVRTLRDQGVRLRHPVEILNFAAEEASLPGGIFGSRALTGQLTPDVLDLPAWDGRPVAEHLRGAGLDPAAVLSAARPAGSFAAYLELHIEQGSVLDRAGILIGLVTGIVGIRTYKAVFHGVANHAGTTPMDDRRDALVQAAPFIAAVRATAIEHGIVGTVGTLRVVPGASNVIPGLVEVGLEIRGLDETVLDAAAAKLAQQVGAAATFYKVSRKAPVLSHPRLLDALAAASADLGLAAQRLPSGAGHDAMCMAALAPHAMLFVPSRAGISHSPDEYTAPQDCINGARVLLGALLRLDRELD